MARRERAQCAELAILLAWDILWLENVNVFIFDGLERVPIAVEMMGYLRIVA